MTDFRTLAQVSFKVKSGLSEDERAELIFTVRQVQGIFIAGYANDYSTDENVRAMGLALLVDGAGPQEIIERLQKIPGVLAAFVPERRPAVYPAPAPGA